MNRLDKLQLRYAVLSLLSSGRVSLFNDSLIALVEYLSLPHIGGLDETADLSAFVLDQMTTLEAEEDPIKVDFLSLFENKMGQD